jgi:hypothetical protein
MPGSPRVAWGSFGVSAAIHAALLVGALLVVPMRHAVITPAPLPPDTGIELEWVFTVEPPPPEEPYRPPGPDEIPGAAAPQLEIVQPSLDYIGGALTFPDLTVPRRPGGETAAERLQPGLTDRRLWAPLPPEFRTLTPEQREELLIAGRFGEWNDSIAAVAAAEAAWRDWTFTDSDGGRWGVSDGQLHLGSLSIPLPMTFEAPAGQRDYMRQFEEIARQGANARVQATLRDRQEAIRERRDRERAAAQGDSTRTRP